MGLADFVKGAIASAKDSGASTAIQRWLARELADYGEVLDFNIDSRARFFSTASAMAGSDPENR